MPASGRFSYLGLILAVGLLLLLPTSSCRPLRTKPGVQSLGRRASSIFLGSSRRLEMDEDNEGDTNEADSSDNEDTADSDDSSDDDDGDDDDDDSSSLPLGEILGFLSNAQGLAAPSARNVRVTETGSTVVQSGGSSGPPSTTVLPPGSSLSVFPLLGRVGRGVVGFLRPPAPPPPPQRVPVPPVATAGQFQLQGGIPPGFNQQPFFQQSAFPQQTFPQPGFPQQPFPQPGFPQQQFAQPGFPQQFPQQTGLGFQG